MADFLPAGQTPATKLMLDELRSGAAASLVLIGIEGASPDDLARISRSVPGHRRTALLDRLVGLPV